MYIIFVILYPQNPLSHPILCPINHLLFLLSTFFPPKPHWDSFICPLSTRPTVIQEVDSSSLESNYQSFASLMEQRLAELFLVAGRQGSQIVRSRRATTVAGCTVQVHTHLLFVCFAWGFYFKVSKRTCMLKPGIIFKIFQMFVQVWLTT